MLAPHFIVQGQHPCDRCYLGGGRGVLTFLSGRSLNMHPATAPRSRDNSRPYQARHGPTYIRM